MLTVSDISPKGLAVGTLTTSAQPGDIVTFDLKTPASIKQLTAVNEDVLAGRSSARSRRSGTRRSTA